MKKTHDLVVKTGTYKKNDGSEAANWLRVGALFDSEKGKFILLDKTFNPAGVVGQEGKSNIMISLFEPKEKQQSNNDAQSYAQATGASIDDNDMGL